MVPGLWPSPLAEQRRIVAKVKELMPWCDQLEAHLTTGRIAVKVINHLGDEAMKLFAM